MKINHKHLRLLAAACALALIAMSGLAGAQGQASPPAGAAKDATGGPEASAVKHVNEAVGVVQRMLQEPRMSELLQQAKGIFIVPTYGRAALGLGASGGTGLLLVKRAGGSWGEPLFYNIGGISAGAQVGAEAGAISLVLNNEKAVNKFMQKNAFALNAEAGLTFVDWSKIAQGSLGAGDVVAWSGTKGLYGNLVAVGVSDIRYNENLTNGFYRQTVTLANVLNGKVAPNKAAEPLKKALSSAPAPAAGTR